MKTILVGLVLAIGGSAFAASGTPSSSVKSFVRSIDSNGNAIAFTQDKPWNVFALEYATAGVQVVDAAGKAPKQGLVGRICLESAPAIAAASDWVILWDTAVAVGSMAATGTGRRIFPPVQRVSGVEHCVDVNTQFTTGLGIMAGATTGSAYVYWK